MRSEYVVQREGFAFDYMKCLRSETVMNDCSLCIELCPEEAMVFDRKRLTLDTQKCTACASCMGVCPTQALRSEAFDPERFVLSFAAEEGGALTCRRGDLPCLAALSPEHLIALALRKGSGLECETGECEGCELNRTGTVLPRIHTIVEEANRFLEAMGAEERVECVERVAYEPVAVEQAGQEVDESRRALFRKISSPVEEGARGTIDDSELSVSEDERQPLKRILLKKSLKCVAERFPEDTRLEGPFEFVVGKRIDAGTCTNCQECAMFCPTGALSILQDNTGIIFQVGKCIHCAICNDICKPRSIDNVESFDLVAFAFDRMELLVKHTLEFCEECKVAFPYRGGEKICDRCRDFRDNHSDLFTLAKDLE